MKKYRFFALIILGLGIAVMAYAALQLAGTRRVYGEGDSMYEGLRASVRRSVQTGGDGGADGFAGGNASESDGASESDSASVTNSNSSGAGGSGADGSPGETGMGDGNGAAAAGMPGKTSINDGNGANGAGGTTGGGASSVVDFEQLKAVSADAVAWLYCPGTVIDYPVMKADDYDYYLRHLADGTLNANGALFIDYNCAPDFSGRLTVIYGHHMKSGKMFGGLSNYKRQKYYEDHPVMYLYTEGGDYLIELLYGCVISAEDWREGAYMYQENVVGLMELAGRTTTFKSNATIDEKGRFVALSTCSYEFNDARFVVIGALQ